MADPVHTSHLFDGLHGELMRLLRTLSPADWERPTLARAWQVRDVAAHIIDGQLRRLSFHRDRHPLPPPNRDVSAYEGLVGFLNDLNAQWVHALRRASPAVIVDLLDTIGPQFATFMASLDPQAPAFFPVAWAGDRESPMWMDVGRDYTELWHHQAQIRDAVGAPPLLAREWFHPVVQLSMLSLRRGLAASVREPGAAVKVEVTGDGGGVWSAVSTGDGWHVEQSEPVNPSAVVTFDSETAWRLLYNALDDVEARRRANTKGDDELVTAVLRTRSVMV